MATDFFKRVCILENQSKERRICRYLQMEQGNEEIRKVTDADRVIFFGISLSNGIIIFSIDRDDVKDQKDDKTRMYINTPDSLINTIEYGTWKYKKPGFRFKYVLLRL